ncbi:DUF6879 family protein [Streptomyces sp. MBT53]|uniref:DUF6879 family protein n=1 Tax=Streptomyces sp. MBT53 TaxID=1488384 RepID=UPI0019123AE8|nr:DUF6879 family protein [Streptomyces sp. MBT53]MBK6012585.1 hypothetical protein [Streptomyces sp. MBT53]
MSRAETPGVRAPSISALVASPPEARSPFLTVKEYLQAFRADYARPEVTAFDKLECGQHFQEPGFSSWEAFNRGAWRESVDLVQEAQPAIKRQFDDAESRGLVLRRARYVELPPSDYLVWEMAVLRERVSRGERIRVVVGQGRPSFQAPPPDGFPNSSFSGPSVSMN